MTVHRQRKHSTKHIDRLRNKTRNCSTTDQKSKRKNCILSSCPEQFQSFMYLYFKDWLLRIFLNVFQKKTEKREIHSPTSTTLGVFIDVPQCVLVKSFSSLFQKKSKTVREKSFIVAFKNRLKRTEIIMRLRW